MLAFAVGAVVIALTGNNVLDAYAALARRRLRRLRGHRTHDRQRDPVGVHRARGRRRLPRRAVQHRRRGPAVRRAVCCAGVGVFMPGPGWARGAGGDRRAAGLGGFVWGAIPGLLKGLGAHEVITTIMLNYVGINLTYYLARTRCRVGARSPAPPASRPTSASRRCRSDWAGRTGASGSPCSPPSSRILSSGGRRRGFELRTVGLAPEAARFAGMPVFANSFLALAVAGAVRRLGGGSRCSASTAGSACRSSPTSASTASGRAARAQPPRRGGHRGAVLRGARERGDADAVRHRRPRWTSRRCCSPSYCCWSPPPG